MTSSEVYESQGEEEDEAEYTEDEAGPSNRKGKSRSKQDEGVMWTGMEMNGRS